MEHTLDSFFQEQTWLRALARSLVRNDAEAEDLVQETWLAALQHPPQNPENPRPWLRVVIRRLASRRRARQEVELSEPDAHVGGSVLPETVAARWESSQLLRDAIDGLPAAERTVVLLRYQEEGTLEEVAATLGVSQRTVSDRLRSARDRLRFRLGDHFLGESLEGDEELRLPAWLAALAPLVEVDEWAAAVTRRLARAAESGGRVAGGMSAPGLSLQAAWMLLAAGVLVATGIWLVPRWTGSGTAPEMPIPDSLATLESSAGSLAAEPSPPSSNAPASRGSHAVIDGEQGPTPSAPPRGRVGVELAVTTTDGVLHHYRLRLRAGAGVPSFERSSSRLSLRGTASVGLPPSVEFSPVALILEPDPDAAVPASHVGRPTLRIELEPEPYETSHAVALEFALGTIDVEVPPTSAAGDLRVTEVVLQRAATEWPQPKGAAGAWTITAKAPVRRGRARFEDVPAGTYTVEYWSGDRPDRGSDVEVRSASDG